MEQHLITQEAYLQVIQILDWFEKDHLVLWFLDRVGRHRRTEVMLPRLVRKGKLTVLKYHHKLVYAAPRLTKGQVWNVHHGLGITEGLVRLIISDRSAEIISERWFAKHGYHVHPEFGLKYSNATLFYEFCTRDNSNRIGVINSKIERYKKYSGIVLFVMDIQREKAIELVNKLLPGGAFWFIDYTTFKGAPFGQQLIYPYYVNGGKGEILPLKGNV